MQVHDAAGYGAGERHQVHRQRFAGRIVHAVNLGRLPLGVIAANQQHALPCPGCARQKTEKSAHGFGQGDGIIQRRRGLHDRQNFFNGFAERHQAAMQAPFPLGGTDTIKLAADRSQKRLAIQVLVLVQVIADAHAHGIEGRRLVGEARNHDRDDVGIEKIKIFQKL